MRKRAPRASTELFSRQGTRELKFSADNGAGAANDSILIWGYADLLIEAQSYGPSCQSSIADSYDKFMDCF